MDIGEAVAIPELIDVKDECPFPHDVDKPPTVKNNLIGKGSALKTSMGNGSSTNLYEPYKPDTPTKWGKVPQEDPKHPFYKKGDDKGRCVAIHFHDATSGKDEGSKNYPVSCSAHHLIPSQESLKESELLEYMCKKGTSDDHNHGFGNGTVWSDVGYDTNGSENGVYLPGSYAVGGGRGGIRVWYSLDDDPDWEHDYLEVEKLPPAEYSDFLIYGKKGEIAEDNACWHYVSQAMLTARGQFHDRHIDYSEQIVLKALGAIYKKFKTFDVTLGGDCSECKKRKKKIEEQGLPAPYTLVYRLEFTSKKLRGYLTAMPGSWRKNVYTSIWCKKYMEAVLAGDPKRKAAEMFE